MIKTALAGVLIAAQVMAPAIPKKPVWRDLGPCRITTYCPACNEPAGYQSSSGKTLSAGDAACSWLPIGTEISVEGEIFTIVDTCGTDAIDLFVDDGSGECHCNVNEYRDVKEKRK